MCKTDLFMLINSRISESHLTVLLYFVLQSPHGSCLTLVEGLKIEFSRLIDSADLSAMPQGEMLLMGFDGLFRNVNLGRDALIQSLALLQTPPSWKTVDQIRDAKSHYTVSRQSIVV